MQIEAIAYYPHSSGALRGHCDLALGASGLRVKDCGVFEKDGRWWVSFPTRSYTTRNGELRHQALIEFGDDDSRERFQKLALAALRFRFPAALGAIPVAACDDREHL
jgi:hypothetical protein